MKSLRRGKPNWTQDEVDRWANEFVDALPPAVHRLFQRPSWGKTGGVLFQLKSVIATPLPKEVSANATLLLPLVKLSPEKVPSQYFLGDVFLKADELLGKMLFITWVKDDGAADPTMTKECQALREGTKAAKLMSKLRYMFRGECRESPCANISQLKKCLRRSPRSKARCRASDDESQLSDPAAVQEPATMPDEVLEEDDTMMDEDALLAHLATLNPDELALLGAASGATDLQADLQDNCNYNCLCVRACVHSCVSVSVSVSLCVSVSVCVFVCMYVCMCVCLCMWMCVCLCLWV
jgi:hypothetical protein